MNDAASPASRLDRMVETIAHRHAAPGGAVAVLRDGEVLVRHSWGWADSERRIPFTPESLFLVCSITKQFTCSLLLDQFPDPDVLDGDVRARLPDLQATAPRTRELCHNQSGIRDYWSTAMLCGAPAEREFSDADAWRLIGRSRTLQFAPGTRNSYGNQNFRMLSAIIEARTGRGFGELLRSRVFDRAGMPHAVVNADTRAVQGGTVGYEGSLEDGFRAAVNRISWTGDAGIAASLDDMIAWERFIDATRDDPAALYSRISAPVAFRDGAPAGYGFGLGRARLLGRKATSHAGGLRGWRSFRCNLPEDRISVVVLFNHMADPRAAALDLLGALIEAPAPEVHAAPPGDWAGLYEEPETGLAVRIETAPEDRLRLQYDRSADVLTPDAEGFAGAGTLLRHAGDSIVMHRPGDHQTTRLVPLAGAANPDVEGVFRNDELDATITVVRMGGVPYAAFSGDLGEGMMQALLPFGRDHWLLPCARALDYSPPGDWTFAFHRDGSGRATGLRLGCWLARRLEYTRV